MRAARQTAFPIRDRARFLKRLAVLLQEGYLFPAALSLLLPIHTDRPDEAESGIVKILKGGGTAAEVLEFLGYKQSVLFSVANAEYHGRLAGSIGAIALSFERTEQVRKKLLSILLYPVSLLLFTALLFLLFRMNYVPELNALSASLHSEGSSSSPTVHLLKLPDLFIGCFLAAAAAGGLGYRFIRRRPVPQQLDFLLKIPLAGMFLRLFWTQVLARELGTLLHSGISLQESLRLLTEQTHDRIISHLSGAIHEEVTAGHSLSAAVSHHQIYSPDLELFIAQGESSGHLGKELILYSEMLMDRMEKRTQQLIRLIQPAFFVLIAVCIIGAYLSILLPMYDLVRTI